MTDAERYEEWERIQVENLDKFLELLPMLPKHPIAVGFWTDGDEILTKNEAHADALADFIDSICGMTTAHTGYYDPVEDERSGEVDDHTGYYYVDFD